MVKNRFYSHIKKHYDIEKIQLKHNSKVKGKKKVTGTKRKGQDLNKLYKT